MSGGAGPTEPGGPEEHLGLSRGSVFAGLVIEQEIGRGGMGVIYRVRDPELDRIRALKVLAAERSREAEFRERFRRESRQAAAIEHEHVVPVYRAGEEEGRLFLLMRFVDGPSLADLLANGGRLPLDQTVGLIDQVAAGLDAAHAAGLVHRDVKPANILLEQTGSEWRAFLGDFGISKLTADAADLTSTGQFVGTVDYVAPEQLEGGRVDARADVYSLACVAFHCLTGEPPFRRDTQLATMFAHANAPRPLPEGMPSKVAETLVAGMAVRPSDRPESAGEFARELERAAGEAGVAPTLSLERPGARRLRWWPLAAAVVVAVAALAAVLVITQSDDDPEAPPPPAVTVGPAIDVPKRPLGVAVGPQRTWVVSRVSGTLASIVPGESKPEKERKVGEEPAAVAVGLGAVWVVDGARDELLRIDPESGKVVRRDPVGDAPSDVAIGEDHVWVASAGDNTVSAVDPESGATQRPLRVGPEPVGLAVADGSVWVVSRGGRSAISIDEEEVELSGVAIPLGQKPSDVAADAAGVWVTDNIDGTLTRLNPETGEMLVEPIEVGPQPRGVALGLGYVWVALGGDGTVVRLDPETGERVGEPIPVGSDTADVAVGPDAVWAADSEDSTVTELLLGR
jgi:DNA-binding beta-propeller fold protein YncE/tRNA A-37 threonylcarbamoyl transferase component Bud32